MTVPEHDSTAFSARPFHPVSPGGRLAVVAPASPSREEDWRSGAEVLEAAGFELVFYDYADGPLPYLAGSDQDRADQLSQALADPTIDGVVCLRGGYGCQRTAGGLDFAALAEAAKPVAGFSDCTVLLSGLLTQGAQSIHGPALVSLGRESAASQQRYVDLLSGGWADSRPLTGIGLAGTGPAVGRLVGGNLCLLSHLTGTPWQPPTAGGIVFLEDVHEKLYRLDRYLTHLLTAGFFRGVVGIAVGWLDNDDQAALDLIMDRLGPLGVPILGRIQLGHRSDNLALVVGARAELDPTAGRLNPLAEE